MAETYSNGGTAVIDTGAISSGATTLPTVSRVGMPSTGSFRILVENEIMQVTTGGQSTASWTVVRGTEGTTAVAHLAGVAITQVLTASGLLAGLTGAAGAGGAFPLGTLSPPSEGSFAWVNQGSGPVAVDMDTTLTGQTTLYDSDWGTQDQIRGRAVTLASGGLTWTVGLRLLPPWRAGQKLEAGMFYSDGTKFVTFGVRWDGAGAQSLVLSQWTNATTRNGSFTVLTCPSPLGQPIFLKTIVDPSTTHWYQASLDNSWFVDYLFDSNRESFMASSTITKYGYYLNYVDLNSLSDVANVGAQIIHAHNT